MEPAIKVVCLVPRYNAWVTWDTACGVLGWPTQRKDIQIMPQSARGSLLPHTFNRLWCTALKLRRIHGATHAAMVHADIGPGPWWVDTLLAELDRLDADVISVVSPIKGEEGITSTAMLVNGERACRRLTLQEVHMLPETFSSLDIPYEGTLLVNTGCFLADIRKPWAEEVVFRETDRIEKYKDDFQPSVMSEDWNWSLDMSRWTLNVYATRKVHLKHWGEKEYDNSSWGTWGTDEEYLKIKAEDLIYLGSDSEVCHGGHANGSGEPSG